MVLKFFVISIMSTRSFGVSIMGDIFEVLLLKLPGPERLITSIIRARYFGVNSVSPSDVSFLGPQVLRYYTHREGKEVCHQDCELPSVSCGSSVIWRSCQTLQGIFIPQHEESLGAGLVATFEMAHCYCR
jgi:hypothetical protein